MLMLLITLVAQIAKLFALTGTNQLDKKFMRTGMSCSSLLTQRRQMVFLVLMIAYGIQFVKLNLDFNSENSSCVFSFRVLVLWTESWLWQRP